jgi:hypothetical protein
LRFVGLGAFAARLTVGTAVVVTRTCGTRSLFELGGAVGATWPEHAMYCQVVDPADPAVPGVTSNTNE